MKFFDILLVFFLVGFLTVYCENAIFSVFRKFLDNLNIPLKITAIVCWDFDKKVDFLRQMNDGNGSGYLTGYRKITIDDFPNELDEHQIMIVVDLDCNETDTFLTDVGHSLYTNYKWFILDGDRFNQIEENVFQVFEYLPALPSSEIFYAENYNNPTEYLIKQIYRPSLDKPLIVELYGVLVNTTLTLNSTLITSRRRQNLQHSELSATIVITNNDSLNHLTDYHDQHIDTITKVNYILTNQLIEYLNATINYTVVNTWGYLDTNTSKWSGMIGDLWEKRSQLGASPLFFTLDRLSVIDYIAMTTATRSKFVFHSPKLSYTENVFVLPFDSYVWASLIGLIVITILLIYYASFLEWREPLGLNTDNNHDPILQRPTFADIFILVFGATCQQGSSIIPRSTPGRMMTFISFLILMFLYNSYSANIVALLQSPSNKIQTLQDLLNSRLGFGADDTVFNRYYFQHTNETVRKAIYEQKIVRKDGGLNFMSLNEGVEKIRNGLFAFHMELGVGYKLIGEIFLEYEKCGLQEIQYLEVVDPWYAIQKNSTYKELFKVGLMRIHEHGLQNRENSKLYTKKPKCIGGGGNFINVGLIDTRAAMLTIAYGLCASVALLAFEIIFKKFYKHN